MRQIDKRPAVDVITYAMWENYAKRVERKNLREKGESLTFTGITRRAKNHIIELMPEDEYMIVKKGWRETMRKEGEKE